MPGRLAFIVVLGALGSSGALIGVRLLHAPDPSDHDAAAAVVRERFAPGDVVVATPWTLVETRRRLGDLPLLEPRHPHPDDLAGYRRAHLIETRAVGLDPRVREVLASVGEATHTTDLGSVTVTTFALGAGSVRFDLWRELARAEVVAHYPDGAQQVCGRWDRDRWVCPRDSGWSYVGRHIFDIGDDPRPCLWLHPLHRGGTLRVHLPPDLPGSRPAELIGGFGFTRYAARAARAPVRVRIRSAGSTVFEGVHPVAPGWERYRVEVPAGTGQLAVEVETEDNGAAHFCFALRVVETGGAP